MYFTLHLYALAPVHLYANRKKTVIQNTRTHTFVCKKFGKNHFIFHFAIRSRLLLLLLFCFGCSLFCITKFYSKVLLEIIYVCWTYVVCAYHSILPTNYLHKRVLRFTKSFPCTTIQYVWWMYRISTVHKKTSLFSQANEKQNENERRHGGQNIVQTEKFIKWFSIQ